VTLLHLGEERIEIRQNRNIRADCRGGFAYFGDGGIKFRLAPAGNDDGRPFGGEAPSAAKRLAMPRPMPVLPPVTTAILP
jgi:hypothetical protein